MKIKKGDFTALKTINSLVLFSFRTKQPATTALNKRASAKAAIDANADRKSARMYNRFLESNGTLIGKISKAMREKALPHSAGGYYLRAKDVDAVQAIFDEAENKLDQYKAELLAEWDNIPKPKLGSFEQDIRIPDRHEFVGKYSMELQWLRQPASIEGTVLEGVSTETAARVRAESQKSNERSLVAAHAEPVQETLKMLSGAIEHLTSGKRLRNERFEALQAQIKKLDDLNWLELPELKNIANALRPCPSDASTINNGAQKVAAAEVLSDARRIAEQTLKDLGV